MPEWLWAGIILWGIGMLLDKGHEKLEKRFPEWASLALNGLKNAAYMGVLYFALTGHAIFNKEPDLTTPANVKTRIMGWARSQGYSATNDPEHENQINLIVYGSPVAVFKVESSLRTQFFLTFTPEQQEVIQKLRPDRREQFGHKMKVQISGLGLQSLSIVDFPKVCSGYIDFPITERMTQESFIHTAEQVQRAEVLMQDFLEKDFQDIRTHN
jgi:hypothetical protein